MALPNVLLLTIDALRYDAAKKLTALHNNNWWFFKNHYSVAHCSDPSYLALLSGWSPDAIYSLYGHQIYRQIDPGFNEFIPTLPVGLKRILGYKNWSLQPIKVPRFYLNGYNEIIWFKINDIIDIEAKAVKGILTSWDEPWFGFVRAMDCHYPYHGEKRLPRNKLGEVKTDEVREDYWKAVDHLNNYLESFLNWILGEYPNTLIFVTADHGESLGEHGYWDHLFTLYETLVHVPMWVHMPGRGGGRVCRGLTQHVDVVPTICDILGLELEGEGQSWKAWFDGGSEPDRDMVFLVGWGCHPLGTEEEVQELGMARGMWKHRAIRAKQWKYIANWHETKGAGFELYDLERDPQELKDRFKSKPEIIEYYADILYKIAPHFPIPRSKAVKPAYTPEEAREIEGRLRALGYA